MGTIRTKPTKDIFGDGNEKEVIIDNERYTIRTKPTKDLFGDGNEKEIVHNGAAYGSTSCDLDINIVTGIGIVALILSVIFGVRSSSSGEASILPEVLFVISMILFVIGAIIDWFGVEGVSHIIIVGIVIGILSIDLVALLGQWAFAMDDYCMPVTNFLITLLKGFIFF